MPLRSDWSGEQCPVRRSLDVLGDPWILLIVRDVLHGRSRFEDLRRGLGIADAVLSRRLVTMVEAGLLERVDYREDGRRTRAAYVATEAGADLLPVLQQLALWSERHTPIPADGGHMGLLHEPCGEETTSGETCSSCGMAIRSEDMTWVKPWSGTRDRLLGPGVLAPAGAGGARA